jgi:uncharacterized membrane protein
METPRALRIWHVGNWCIHLGQTYVESPFNTEKKDGGRVTGWTTGASHHWGVNFMKWKQYPQLRKQVFAP